MLIEFFGQNFGCFRDEFRLSMLATDIDPDSHRGIVRIRVNGDPEPLKLLRSAALYGPNGSGKSTVLRAARSLGFLISRAGRFRSDEPIPFYEPFASDKAQGRPVRLGLKAVVDGDVYDYEVTFDDRNVLNERLDQHLLSGTRNLLLREKQNVSGEWTTNEQFKLIGHEFRPNALLLSLADTLAPALAKRLAPRLRRMLRFHDGAKLDTELRWDQPAARKASQDEKFRHWLLDQLKAADVGVSDLSVKRLRHVLQGQSLLFEEIAEEISVSPREPSTYRFSFTHSGPEGTFVIPFESESYGTRKIIDLAPVLYNLSSGEGSSTVFVDEIGASLHPTLLSGLIQHVNCDPRDGSGFGQLIFATHETALIDNEAKKAILRRDQVYFTDKDASGVARLYSLGDFSERQNINPRKRYLEGRYGAIPSLGAFPE